MAKKVEEQEENLLDNFSFDLDINVPEDTEEEQEESEEQDEEESEEEEKPSTKRSSKKAVEAKEEEDSEEEQEAEEEESDEDDEELSPYEQAISELVESGDFIIDENGEYEDSTEGLKKIVLHNVEHKFKEKLESLSPRARKLIELEEAGADIAEAFGQLQEFDFDDVDLEDESTRREVLADYYKALDDELTDEELEEKVQDIVDLGKDDKESAKALKYFKRKQKERITAYEEKVLAEKEEADKNYEKEIKKIQSTVKKADGFKGLKFANDAEKDAFLSYILDRDATGKTQAEKDDENMDTILAREFYKFKDFDFKDIERKVTTKKTVEVKKFLKSRDEGVARRGAQERVPTNKKKFDLAGGLPWLDQ